MATAPQSRWAAFYFDGETPTRHEVAAVIMHQGIEIHRSDGSSLWWRHDEIRRTHGALSGQHVRLEKGGSIGEALIIPEREVLQALRQIAPHWQDWSSVSSRSNRLHYVAAAVALAVLLPTLHLWLIPAVAEKVAVHVPVSWEEQLGKAVLGYLVNEGDHCEEPQVTAAVDRIVERLLGQELNYPYTFQVIVAKGKLVNAFAAPGGYIVVFQGLLEETKNPEQLAGVLAHEMQHVLQRHSTRAIFRQLWLRALLAAMFGDVQGTSFALDAAGTLGTLHHHRKDEESADRAGMGMILAARIDPQGMVQVFKRFQEMSSDMPKALQYFSTHPRTEDRIDQLQTMADGASYMSEPLLAEVDWSEVTRSCKAESADAAQG